MLAMLPMFASFAFADGPDKPPVRHSACHNTAVVCDNTRVAHFACPSMFKDKIMPAWAWKETGYGKWTCAWQEDPGRWVARNPEGREVHSWTEEEMRISVQLKIGCFRDEADLARFEDPATDFPHTLDEVFEIFSADLCKRGLMNPHNPLPRSPTAQNPGLYTLQDLIVDTYSQRPGAERIYRDIIGSS